MEGHKPLRKLEPRHCPVDAFPGSRWRKDYDRFRDFIAADPPEIAAYRLHLKTPGAVTYPWYKFIKDEPHSFKKLEEERLRNISAREAEERAEEMRLQYNFCKSIMSGWRDKPLKNAWPKWHGGVWQLKESMTKIGQGGWWEEWDFSDWDITMPLEFEELTQEFFFITRAYDDPADRIADENIFASTNHYFAIDPTGHIWWVPGPGKSGKFVTGVFNGLNNLQFNLLMIVRRYGFEVAARWRTLISLGFVGDDTLKYSLLEPPSEDWLASFFRSLGMKLKPGSYHKSKEFVGMSFVGITFVTGPYGELSHTLKYERALAKLLLFRKDWKAYKTCEVLDAFRAETFHNPAMRRFCGIAMMRLDEYCQAHGMPNWPWRPVSEIAIQYCMMHSSGTAVPIHEMTKGESHKGKGKAKAGPKPKFHKKKSHPKGGPASASGNRISSRTISAPAVMGQVQTRGVSTANNYTLKGTDYLGSVSVANADVNVNGSILRWQAMNPMTMTNTRIRTFARVFQEYRVKKYFIEGAQSQGTQVGGTQVCFFDTDPARITSGQGDQMISYAMTHQLATMSPCWAPIKMKCPLDNKWRKCNPGSGDPRESVFGVLVFALAAPPTASSYPLALYELNAHYEIEFRNPMIQETNVSGLSQAFTINTPPSVSVFPYTGPLLIAAPALPYNVGVAIVLEAGDSDLTPGSVFYVAGDQTNIGGVVLSRNYDAAYTNQAVTSGTKGHNTTWSANAHAAVIICSPISGDFIDLNADGAGVSNDPGTLRNASNIEDEGRLVEMSTHVTTSSAVFEDMNAMLPNTVSFGDVEVEAELCGAMATQGYGPSFSFTSGTPPEPQVGQEVVLAPISVLMASLWNDPIMQYLAKNHENSTLAFLPGFWGIFSKIGQVVQVAMGIAGWIRTAVRAIRQRRSSPVAKSFYANPENIKFIQIPTHLRWLQCDRHAEKFRQADALKLLEWVDYPFVFQNTTLIGKRPFVNASLVWQPFTEEESFRVRREAAVAAIAGGNQFQPLPLQSQPDVAGNSVVVKVPTAPTMFERIENAGNRLAEKRFSELVNSKMTKDELLAYISRKGYEVISAEEVGQSSATGASAAN